MPNASVAFPNSNTRDTKRVADFLSLSKSIYTNRKDTADENIFTRDSDALNARQPLNAALRRSIDIGDMYRERRTNAPATYRL